MIGIRVDGNEKIGSGHVMRCLTIADAMRAEGREPVFFTVDKNDYFTNTGYDCCLLDGVYDDLSGEELKPFLEQKGVSTLLVDSYFADRNYFNKLAGFVRTAAIFDFGDSLLPCDMLINYNMHFDKYEYPKNTKLLLGCSYAPLRAEFQNIQAGRQFDLVSNIMLTTGGTDNYDLTSKILLGIRKNPLFDGMTVHVIIGGMNLFAKGIKQIADQYHGILCYKNFGQMAQMMRKCDVVISAGGTTLYEICACGTPCVTFGMADNQVGIVDAMGEEGVMISAGHYERDEKACLKAILSGLQLLVSDKDKRESFSKKEFGLVDGKGAIRIAKEIIALEDNR